MIWSDLKAVRATLRELGEGTLVLGGIQAESFRTAGVLDQVEAIDRGL